MADLELGILCHFRRLERGKLVLRMTSWIADGSELGAANSVETVPSPVWPTVMVNTGGDTGSKHVTSIQLGEPGAGAGAGAAGRVRILTNHYNARAEEEKEGEGEDEERAVVLRPANLSDRCFGARYTGAGGAVPPDSLVSPSLLALTSPAPPQPALSRALSAARRSLRRSGRRSVRRVGRTGGSRAGSLKAAGGVDAMRELWSRTGMKTNGRKLLIEEAAARPTATTAAAGNAGYESDGESEVSPAPARPGRRLARPGHRKTNSQSSSGSSEAAPYTRTRYHHCINEIIYLFIHSFIYIFFRPARLVRRGGAERGWQVEGGVVRASGLPVVDLDTVTVEQEGGGSEASSGKQVRFHTRYQARPGYSPAPGPAPSHAPSHHVLWDRYYGAVDPVLQVEAGLGRGRAKLSTSTATLLSDLTMDQFKSSLLARKQRRRKRIRCCCKFSCFILLLASFLLVIVTVTYLLTKGKNYFGAL